MGNLKAFILLGVSAWLILINSQFTQAQQLSAISPQSAVSSKVYVVGAVRSPAKFELRRSGRLTELLPCVGGLSPDAKNQIRIYRIGPSAGEKTIIMMVDLKAIKKHPDADLLIQPYDIVEVLSRKKFDFGDCFNCSQRVANALSKLPWRLIK